MSSPAQFPKTIAAVKAREGAIFAVEDCLWRIGDALIEECGPPGEHGVNTGSNDKLEQCAKELAEAGFKRYGLDMLVKLRRTAAAFPDVKRLTSVSWSVHDIAGDDETLLAAQEFAAEKDGAKLTVNFVKKFIEERDAKEAAKDREENPDLDDDDVGEDPAVQYALDEALKEWNDIAEQITSTRDLIQPHIVKLAASDVTKAITALDAIIDSAKASKRDFPKPVAFQEAAE